MWRALAMAERREGLCGGMKKGKNRSRVNPFNLEDETVGPLDVYEIILALRVAGE
jgi:hypothetical protein